MLNLIQPTNINFTLSESETFWSFSFFNIFDLTSGWSATLMAKSLFFSPKFKAFKFKRNPFFFFSFYGTMYFAKQLFLNYTFRESMFESYLLFLIQFGINYDFSFVQLDLTFNPKCSEITCFSFSSPLNCSSVQKRNWKKWFFIIFVHLRFYCHNFIDKCRECENGLNVRLGKNYSSEKQKSYLYKL